MVSQTRFTASEVSTAWKLLDEQAIQQAVTRFLQEAQQDIEWWLHAPAWSTCAGLEIPEHGLISGSYGALLPLRQESDVSFYFNLEVMVYRSEKKEKA